MRPNKQALANSIDNLADLLIAVGQPWTPDDDDEIDLTPIDAKEMAACSAAAHMFD